MALKNRILAWYIKNILLPRIEIIDNPGFIVTQASGPTGKTYLRVLFLPERLIADIENSVIDKYGEKGAKALYSAGKKFGYTFGSLGAFPSLATHGVAEVEKFMHFLINYALVTQATNASYELDMGKRSFKLVSDGYVVCSLNGQGQVVPAGAGAGVMAYAMNDATIECAHSKCVRKGDDRCELVCKPNSDFQGTGTKHYAEGNVQQTKFVNEYLKFNEIRKARRAKVSLKDLIDSGICKWEEGMMRYAGDRYFLLESHSTYMLERELAKLPKGGELLFNAAFSFGKLLEKKVFSSQPTPAKAFEFVTNYFSAIGFGDAIVTNKGHGVSFDLFPWSTYSKESKYDIIKGLCSGILSNALGEKITLSKHSTTESNNGFALKLSE